MEVIQIDLASGLEFVHKVEETKSKDGTRPVPSGREPPNAEQLDVRLNAAAGWVALTVGNINCMDACYIKHGEGDRVRRYLAWAPVVMAKVKDGTEILERHTYKMGPCPFLRYVSIHEEHEM